ncbi:GIY-YIG nuclease family protein [Marinococcus luteus]|uniref:GIY-YIG nuclease family protein n=1 Tax=Marinococcus luteus TaxID=1122204 RepID=UPI002ACC9B12|nr:GIY-YIG nuclease family protein [Marinococcus luteus]MDZ5782447.1 GIY-YIG nuclease family protein [Marinococcus luteus]
MEQNKHVVYILQCRDGSLYTGYTNNLQKRLEAHNAGRGAKYTKGRGPVRLVYHQRFPTKREAMREEYRIKQLSRSHKQRLMKEAYDDDPAVQLSSY